MTWRARRDGHRGQQEVVLLGVQAWHQARELGAFDLDLAAHALGQFLAQVDVEALQAAIELGHRVRREGGVDRRCAAGHGGNAQGAQRERTPGEGGSQLQHGSFLVGDKGGGETNLKSSVRGSGRTGVGRMSPQACPDAGVEDAGSCMPAWNVPA
jgi:hypothetical protein